MPEPGSKARALPRVSARTLLLRLARDVIRYVAVIGAVFLTLWTLYSHPVWLLGGLVVAAAGLIMAASMLFFSIDGIDADARKNSMDDEDFERARTP